MAIQYKRKACAACAYWNGPRNIITSSMSGVTCETSTSIGVCLNPKSSFKKSRGESDELNAK
ncbi:hypothetical protein IMSAGC020_00107 [Lachnospiraceae bacterium]|jgi:hypothetical protein|nr:hypothetical protein IMSAGC020_00107 [Lachnospiraceae bacterium]